MQDLDLNQKRKKNWKNQKIKIYPPIFLNSFTHIHIDLRLIQSFVLNSLLHLESVIVSNYFTSQFGWLTVCRPVWQRHLGNGCIAHRPRPMLPLCSLLPAITDHSLWEVPEYLLILFLQGCHLMTILFYIFPQWTYNI